MLPLCLAGVRIQLLIDHFLRTATQGLLAIFAAIRLRDISGSNGPWVDYATPLKVLSKALKAENLRGRRTRYCKKQNRSSRTQATNFLHSRTVSSHKTTTIASEMATRKKVKSAKTRTSKEKNTVRIEKRRAKKKS